MKYVVRYNHQRERKSQTPEKEKTMESFLKALEADKRADRDEEAVTIDLEDAKTIAYIQIMGYAYQELKRRYKV